MNITGANSIRIAETPSSGQPVEFRLNQKISADILKVSGDQVSLVVQGQQIVGRIASGDEMTLADQKTAQFIVKGMADGMLQLQLVKSETGQISSSLNSQWTILALNLLQLNGLSVNEENLTIGRALLGAGLPITSDLLANMQSVLAGLSSWGQTEADLSASMISNGLPLSTGTLSLTLQNLPSLIDSYQKLQSQLESLFKSTGSSDLKDLLNNSLQILRNTTIDMGTSTTDLMSQLRNSIAVLGKSLESHIADSLKKEDDLPLNGNDTSGMLALAYLQRQLANDGKTGAARELDRFMNVLQQMQFLNSALPKDPNNPPWLMVNLPLAQSTQSEGKNARIKITYRPDDENMKIDPENNRIVFSVDLDENNSLDIDLSMVKKRVGAWLTAPDEDWKKLVEDELPSLKENLETIGYLVQFARCEVKPTTSVIDTNVIHRVDLEA